MSVDNGDFNSQTTPFALQTACLFFATGDANVADEMPLAMRSPANAFQKKKICVTAELHATLESQFFFLIETLKISLGHVVG